MSLTPKKRRGIMVVGGLALALLASVIAGRFMLTTLAMNSVLQEVGASDVSFTVTRASLWRVVVENLRFQLESTPISARRVRVSRSHWWSPSLGAIQVEQARVPVRVEELVRPAAGPPAGVPATSRLVLPMDEVTVDGQLVIQTKGLPEQALTVKFDARRAGDKTWTAALEATGPGVGLHAAGEFDPEQRKLDFRVSDFDLDLKTWQEFGRKLIPVPEWTWEVEGKLSGTARGRLAGGALAGEATVRLRGGRAANAGNSIVVEGVEGDLEFPDFARLATKPATVRAREVRAGRLLLRNLECGFTIASAEKIAVTQAAFQALGGRVSTESFDVTVNPPAVRVTVLAEDISVEEVLALTQDLPATATGRLNGRIPIQWDPAGLRFGTGWLALKPGVRAEVQFDAAGLLTRGVAATNPSYPVLKRVESGLLKLQLSEMRLEIRPPNAPPGRSAELHIAGEPVDPEVRAPVTLDLNVNGPLEKLLNLGLDSRLSFGSKQ